MLIICKVARQEEGLLSCLLHSLLCHLYVPDATNYNTANAGALAVPMLPAASTPLSFTRTPNLVRRQFTQQLVQWLLLSTGKQAMHWERAGCGSRCLMIRACTRLPSAVLTLSLSLRVFMHMLTSASSCSERYEIATSAPSLAYARATALPIPLSAPVTSAFCTMR